jgi:hypothetical protein
MIQATLEVDRPECEAFGSSYLKIIITLQEAVGVRASESAAQVRKCSLLCRSFRRSFDQQSCFHDYVLPALNAVPITVLRESHTLHRLRRTQ